MLEAALGADTIATARPTARSCATPAARAARPRVDDGRRAARARERAHFGRGVVLRKLGRHDEALAAFDARRKAVSRDENVGAVGAARGRRERALYLNKARACSRSARTRARRSTSSSTRS